MLAGIDIVQISRMVEVVEKSDERLERLFLSFTGIMQVRRRTGRPGRRRCQFLMTEIMLWLK